MPNTPIVMNPGVLPHKFDCQKSGTRIHSSQKNLNASTTNKGRKRVPKLRFPDKKRTDSDEDTDATNNAGDEFKGQLRKLHRSDNTSTSEDEHTKATDTNKNVMEDRSSRRTKTRISNVKDPPLYSFVMKLFDRSVDLTQFKPDSPLYPICREWCRNNPRSNIKNNDSKVVQKREDKRVNEKDIFRLPSPLPFCEEYVSSPILPPIVSDDFVWEQDPLVTLKTKEELLAPHIDHWVQIRARMRRASHKKEQRYKRSLSLLREMCCKIEL